MLLLKTLVPAIIRGAAVPASVTLTPSTLALAPGGGATLAVVVKDAGGAVITGETITWRSSAPAVASVTQAGVVAALVAGPTTITAQCGPASGSCALTVVAVGPAPVTQITWDHPLAYALYVGTSVAAPVPTARDAQGNAVAGATPVAQVGSSSVATLAGGQLTGVAVGSTAITASYTRPGDGVVIQAPAVVVNVAAAPVVTPGVLPTVALVSVDNTGLVPDGEVAFGPVFFPPNTVQASDLANYALYRDDTNAEVACYLRDDGAYYPGTTYLRRAHVQHVANRVAGASPPVFTTYTLAQKTGSAPLPRLTPADYSAHQFIQTAPTFAVNAADPTRFDLTSSPAWHHRDETFVRASPPTQAIPWASKTLNGSNTIAVNSNGAAGRTVVLVLGGNSGTGALSMILGNDYNDPAQPPNNNFWPLRGAPAGNDPEAYWVGPNQTTYQCIAAVFFDLQPNTGPFQIGVTPLNDPMVTNLRVAMMGMHDRCPKVTAFPRDPAYLRTCVVTPQGLLAKPVTVAQAQAADPVSMGPTMQQMIYDSDLSWMAFGRWLTFTATLAMYSPTQLELGTLLSRDGAFNPKHLWRAFAYYAGWRQLAVSRASTTASPYLPAGNWMVGTLEPPVDGSMCPFHYALTGDPEARARGQDLLLQNEWLNIKGQVGCNTSRPLMHVVQAATNLEFEGLGAFAGLTTPGDEAHHWPGGRSAANCAQSWQRAEWFLDQWMDNTNSWETSTSYPLNVGLRRLVQDGEYTRSPTGDYWGSAPWMASKLWTECLTAQAVFTPKVGRLTRCDTNMRDSFTYYFTAVRNDGTTKLLYDATTPGFCYSERDALVNHPGGPNGNCLASFINNWSLLPLHFLATQVDSTNPAWATRRDGFASVYANWTKNGGDKNAYYFGKSQSEAFLFAATYVNLRYGIAP